MAPALPQKLVSNKSKILQGKKQHKAPEERGIATDLHVKDASITGNQGLVIDITEMQTREVTACERKTHSPFDMSDNAMHCAV